MLRWALTTTAVAAACLIALVRPSHATKYAAASSPTLNRSAGRVDLDGQRRATGQLAQRRIQSGVELRRRKSVRQLAQLVDRDRDLGHGTIDRLVGASRMSRAELVLGVAQPQPDRDQPLLRAVVEVALDPPAFGVSGRHDPRA